MENITFSCKMNYIFIVFYYQLGLSIKCVDGVNDDLVRDVGKILTTSERYTSSRSLTAGGRKGPRPTGTDWCCWQRVNSAMIDLILIK